MAFKIVTWNMGRCRAQKAWDYLENTLRPTAALLQEGLNPPYDNSQRNSVWKDWLHHNKRKMGWGCGIVAYGYQAQKFNWPRFTNDENTLVVAEMTLPKQRQIIMISLYGVPDYKLRHTPDLHRKLSDLTPILEDRCFRHHIILGGDFNATTERDTSKRRENQILFDRIQDFGLVDCLAKFHPGHAPTHINPRGQVCSQLDYLFASAALAQRLTKCEVINTPEVHGLSDHNPILAEFDW